MVNAHNSPDNSGMNDPNSALGGAIARLRQSAGITQAQAAEALGIDQGGLSRVENGKQALPSDKLASLAKVLRVNPSQIWALAETVAAETPAGTPASTRRNKGAVSRQDMGALRYALATIVGTLVSGKPALGEKLSAGFRSAPEQYLGHDGLLLALVEVSERAAKAAKAR